MKTNLENRTLHLSKQITLFCFLFYVHSGIAQPDTTRQINPVLIVHDVDTIVGISDLNSTVPSYVMNEKSLKLSARTDIGSVMKFIPGVQVKDYGGAGGMRTVSFRSMSANYTGLIVDGIKIPNIQSGVINLSSFEIFGVNQLRFTTGQPEHFLNGASSFIHANTLEIQTKLNQYSPNFYASVFSLGNTIGLFQHAFLIKTPVSKKWFVGAQGLVQHGNGKYNYTYDLAGTETVLKRDHSKQLLLKGRALIGCDYDKGKFRLFLNWLNNEQELPGAVILYNPYSQQKIWNQEIRLSLTNALSLKSWSLFSHAYVNDANLRYVDLYYPNTVGILMTDFHQTNYSAGTILSKKFKKLKTGIFFGTEGIYSKLNGDVAALPIRSELSNVVGLKYIGDLFKAEANLSNQLIQDEYTENDNRKTINHQAWNPFLSFALTPFKKLLAQFRGSYKQQFLAPTLNDLYYNLIGNTNLKPEQGDLFNLGFSFKQFFKNSLIEISADAFYSVISNKIVAIPTKDLFTWSMQNIGKTQSQGFDASVYSYWSKKNHAIHLQAAYTMNFTADITDENSTTYGHQIPYTPFHSGSFQLTYAYKEYSLSGNGILSGFRYSLNENNYANYLPGFIDLGFSIGRKIAFSKTINGEVFISAQNVLNVNYQIIRSFPMPGRNYQLSVRVDFL